jgi:hypothetical protein
LQLATLPTTLIVRQDVGTAGRQERTLFWATYPDAWVRFAKLHPAAFQQPAQAGERLAFIGFQTAQLRQRQTKGVDINNLIDPHPLDRVGGSQLPVKRRLHLIEGLTVLTPQQILPQSVPDQGQGQRDVVGLISGGIRCSRR